MIPTPLKTRATRARHSRAFTLLEVLIAVSLVVGLMASVLVFYRYAIDTRTMVIDQAESVTARRMVMDRITSELRAAVAAPSNSLQPLSGTTSTLVIPTAGSLPRSIWRVDHEAESPPPVGVSDVSVVNYSIRSHTDDDGKVVVEGLDRGVGSAVVASSDDSTIPPPPPFATRVKFVRFRYYDGATWAESWGGGSLPQAVEVSLGLDPLPEGVEPSEYSSPVSRRVIALPAAPRRAATAARGTP